MTDLEDNIILMLRAFLLLRCWLPCIMKARSLRCLMFSTMNKRCPVYTYFYERSWIRGLPKSSVYSYTMLCCLQRFIQHFELLQKAHVPDQISYFLFKESTKHALIPVSFAQMFYEIFFNTLVNQTLKPHLLYFRSSLSITTSEKLRGFPLLSRVVSQVIHRECKSCGK